jgi:hypothetical protein
MTVPSWEDMSADQRRAKRLEDWQEAEVAFASPEAEANYRARVDRLLAASTLGRPDRVPVVLSVGFWPTQLAGMTPYESMTDFVRAAQAWLDFALEFQPDSLSGARSYLIRMTPTSSGRQFQTWTACPRKRAGAACILRCSPSPRITVR